MTGDLPSNIVAGIAFVGRSSGAVKLLGGFKKGHHTLPDAANATTNAFLGKICAAELSSQAEQLFQSARASLSYKRKDIALSVASPIAVLTAKDFVVEIGYALDDVEPTRYSVLTTLREVRNVHLIRTPEFNAVFDRMFTEISFALKKGASVEAVIDAIEALDGENGLTVSFPSDYAHCTIHVEGVEAEVRCTGGALDIIFPTSAAPEQLVDAFAEIRRSFAISKQLSGLIG